MPRFLTALLLLIMLATPAAAAGLALRVKAQTLAVQRGRFAYLAVQTVPGAWCILTHRQRNSTAAVRLLPRRADRTGEVGWFWRVTTTAPPGRHDVSVACVKGGRSGSLTAFYVVVE